MRIASFILMLFHGIVTARATLQPGTHSNASRFSTSGGTNPYDSARAIGRLVGGIEFGLATGGGARNATNALSRNSLRTILGDEGGFARIGQVATNYVRKALPALPKSFERAFEGVRARTFRAGERIYRSPQLEELVDKLGRWFSTRATVTRAGTESQANIVKWGNPVGQLRAYEFTRDVTVYYGKAAGGKGYQVLIPRDVRPSDILRFIEERKLR